MKVVHIGMYHRYDDVRILNRECASLVQGDYNVTYMTSDLVHVPDCIDTIDGVTIKQYPFELQNFAFQWNLFAYFKGRSRIKGIITEAVLRERPHVLHIHEYYLLFLVKRIQRAIPNVKVIYDIHEDTPKEQGGRYIKKFGKNLGRAVQKYVEIKELSFARRVDAVIAATPYIAAQFRNKAKVIQTICNFPVMEDIEHNSTAISTREKNVCYAGGLTEERGITSIVKNAKQIDGMIILAGAIDSGYMHELQVTYPDVWGEKVKYKGYLKRTDIRKLYGQSVVGLCTLLWNENFYNALPVKIFEYMAAGIPVVCSDFPLWKQIVEENECGIAVNPDNEKSIIEAVNQLLSDRELAQRYGLNGKRAIIDKYNWSKEERKLLSIYERLKT